MLLAIIFTPSFPREVSYVTAGVGEGERLLAEPAVDRAALARQLNNIKEQLVQLRNKGGESIAEEAQVRGLLFIHSLCLVKLTSETFDQACYEPP